VQFVSGALLQSEQARAQPRGVCKMNGFHEPELLAARGCEDCINAVEARSRHDS
jgi:hypothetical protein